MLDLCQLIPHCKKESKLDTKDERAVINEVAELQGCTSAVFFEARPTSTLIHASPPRVSHPPRRHAAAAGPHTRARNPRKRR